MLVKCLGVPVNSTPAPDVVLVDASQLLYHVVWPVAGTAGDLALSVGVRLSSYRPEAKTNWCCLTAITRMNQLRRSTVG